MYLGRLTKPVYYNTNGLGLMEFLEWTEAMEMENVLAIYSVCSVPSTFNVV